MNRELRGYISLEDVRSLLELIFIVFRCLVPRATNPPEYDGEAVEEGEHAHAEAETLKYTIKMSYIIWIVFSSSRGKLSRYPPTSAIKELESYV